MKRALRLLALIVAAAAGIWWLAAGGNRGWTKTSVPIKTVDEVTGIEGIEYRKRLVPGVDFLAGAFFGAGLLALASLVFRDKRSTIINT